MSSTPRPVHSRSHHDRESRSSRAEGVRSGLRGIDLPRMCQPQVDAGCQHVKNRKARPASGQARPARHPAHFGAEDLVARVAQAGDDVARLSLRWLSIAAVQQRTSGCAFCSAATPLGAATSTSARASLQPRRLETGRWRRSSSPRWRAWGRRSARCARRGGRRTSRSSARAAASRGCATGRPR